MPLSPSTITLRAPAAVAPTSAKRRAAHVATRARTSSVPVRVSQIRGRRGEATPASCLAAAAASSAPRMANHRAAPEPRGGSMWQRDRFSRARAAKPANPRVSPSTASLRRASALPSSMIAESRFCRVSGPFDPLRRRFRQFRTVLSDRSGFVNHEMLRSQS